LVIYEHQEGRGIGLMAKLQAYSLQDNGLDTVEANHALGLAADYRDFSLPAAILSELGVTRVRLLSTTRISHLRCRTPALMSSAGFPVKLRETFTRFLTCERRKKNSAMN